MQIFWKRGNPMDEHRSRQRERWLIPAHLQRSEGRVQYLLETEERILRSIAVRAPVPQILNEICTALDCQIGNMVSLISLPQDDIASTAEIARNAALFGLHIFSSAGIFGECDEELGSLEMYCCTARNPSFPELQLIERAVCLAAIAMECETKGDHQYSRRSQEKAPVHKSVPRWPVSMN
jgi:hypothetical protein